MEKNEFEKKLSIISFKSFIMKEIDESKKDSLNQFHILVTVKPEVLTEFLQSKDAEQLDKKVLAESNSLLKMLNKTEDKWSNLDWLRCKKVVGIIQKELTKDEKDETILRAYGHM